MAKRTGGTRATGSSSASASRTVAAPTEQDILESLVTRKYEEGLLSIDPDDALYTTVGEWSSRSLGRIIENATDYDVMNSEKFPTFTRLTVLNRNTDPSDFENGDNGWRIVEIASNSNIAKAILALDTQNLKRTTNGNPSLRIK